MRHTILAVVSQLLAYLTNSYDSTEISLHALKYYSNYVCHVIYKWPLFVPRMKCMCTVWYLVTVETAFSINYALLYVSTWLQVLYWKLISGTLRVSAAKKVHIKLPVVSFMLCMILLQGGLWGCTSFGTANTNAKSST